MSANVMVTGIRGVKHYGLPLEGKITTRGRNRKNAKPGECVNCGDKIAVGEQYIRVGEEFGTSYCLACAEYS